jgi:RNA polymerase sigma factor (sigma-70 family)
MTDDSGVPGQHPDEDDDLENLSPDELERLERELGLSDLSFRPGPPSPLIAARVAAARARGTSHAEEVSQRYEALRERIDRLNSPDTPWEERLSLLRELEAAGWGKLPYWASLRRSWLHRGAEWRIPISDEDCTRLEELGKAGGDPAAWREAVAGVLRAWYERDAALAGQILHDPDGVWFLSAWVACRVWAGTEEYASFLLGHVVGPALADVKAEPTLPLLLNPDQSTASPLMALTHEGYIGLLETIEGTIHQIAEGHLLPYWRVAVKNYFRDRLKAEKVRHRGVVSLEQPTREEPDSPTIGAGLTVGDPQLAALETMAEGIEQLETLAALESKERLERFRTLLTPRQQQLVLLKLGDLDNAEVATRLDVSESTVEKERRKIRQIATQLGISPG